MTSNIMTISIKGLFVTLGIKVLSLSGVNTQNKMPPGMDVNIA